MLIKGYDLNNELIMELGKFAVLWNLFEKNHCYYNCNPEAIIYACNYIRVSKDSQAELAKALNDMQSRLEIPRHEFIINVLYSNSRNPKADEIQYIEAFLNEENDSIKGCLLSVYRIRNNMMHGLKNIEGLNNQLEIFKAANKVLEEL